MRTYSERVFSSADDFQSFLVEAASEGALILTVTSRLSRAVVHAYRMKRIRRGQEGWKTPDVSSLNRWVMNAFHLLWETRRPLPRLAGLRLWDKAVQGTVLPKGLKPGPSLSMELQEALDVLTRHEQELTGGPRGFDLADWRREVSGHFLNLVESHHGILWAQLLKRVGGAVKEREIPLPEKIVLAGFDEFYPAEQSFVRSLSERAEVLLWRASRDPEKGPGVKVFATAEQECQSVCAEVLREWNQGCRRLGVVFLDQDNFRLLSQCFEELADREARPPDALRYNLTAGTPLSEHPLYQTAVIPLRLLDDPHPVPLLSSLLSSPYVSPGGGDRAQEIRTRLWNLRDGTSGAETLRGCLKRFREGGYPVNFLQGFVSEQERSMREWLDALERLWESLGFPICRRETDTLSKEHLLGIVDQLRMEAGDLMIDRGEVMAWFSAACQGIEVVEKTPETAGIQILPLVEARGLAFERLWVVGTHGRALPQPVRNLPFLDPDERKKIQGGTAETQWEAGRRNLSCLLAGAPRVSFSRAMAKGEDAPYLPCPLISDEAPEDRSTVRLDLWKEPLAEWLRARWLREGWRGLQSLPEKGFEERDDRVNARMPAVLDVTGLEDLLSCPFRFFANRLLALEPLQEPALGIDPSERGIVIHEILKEFTMGLANAAPRWPEDEGEALDFLLKTVKGVLAKKPEDAFWRAERLRLVGGEESEGLLTVWLEKERDRARDGWRFEAAEERFEGLSVGGAGFLLKGRVDRVDHHPREGRILWDYKTGKVPSAKEVVEWMVRPQLPSYLLSLRGGLLRRCAACPPAKAGAGYIVLRRASEVGIKPLKDSRQDVNWDDVLVQWENSVRERLNGPLEGLFPADPKPAPNSRGEGVCKDCPYPALCGLELQPPGNGEDSVETGETGG